MPEGSVLEPGVLKRPALGIFRRGLTSKYRVLVSRPKQYSRDREGNGPTASSSRNPSYQATVSELEVVDQTFGQML